MSASNPVDFFSVVSLYSRHADVNVVLLRMVNAKTVRITCENPRRSVFIFDQGEGVQAEVAAGDPDWPSCCAPENGGDPAFDAVADATVVLTWLRGCAEDVD